MQLKNIDVIHAQSFQRTIEAFQNLIHGERGIVHRLRCLGAHDDAIARHVRQCAANHFLGAINRRRIDQVDAKVESLTDDTDRVILGLADADAAETTSAKAGDTDPQPGAAKRGIVHPELSVLIGTDTIRDARMARQVEVIGHRGARGLFPENTIEGFRRSLDLGVRSFELDVGMTADGIVVVSHDPALSPAITRGADGRWLNDPGPLIRDLTFDVLRSYDVGRIRPKSAYRLQHRAQIACDGARIPALKNVLLLAADATFVIELKTDPRHPDQTVDPVTLAEAVLSVVDRIGASERVILESFDWRGPRHIRRVRPEIKTAWLTRDETLRDAALWWDGIRTADFGGSVPKAVAAQGGNVWAPAFGTTTRSSVSEAHDLGLRVLPWTVNRRAAMRRLISWGVDGLITDRPDIAMIVTGAAADGQSDRS